MPPASRPDRYERGQQAQAPRYSLDHRAMREPAERQPQ
jgi:hypothetical protein